jgi:aryl-alcohol dehydrogenase-like predicted oxidoreductase
MQTRILGDSDLDVTVIGLGGWALGGEWQYGWGSQSDDESIAAIHRALELGINWIDTAAVYGLGRSEKVVCRAIKGLSEKPLIATKCGLLWDENGSSRRFLSAESVRKEVEDSLKRLQVEVIDLYQIHWPVEDDSAIQEAWGAIAEAIEAGKIRYGGVSNFNVRQMELCRKIHPITSLQPPFSMLVRGIEKEILPYCGKNNIGVIVYSPMRSGLLTGKYDKKTIERLPDDDWRKRYNPDFKEPNLSANLNVLERIRPIADKHGKSLAELSIAWALAPREVTAAIVGARRPSQVEGTVGAADWRLTSNELTSIDKALEERNSAIG